MVKPMEEWTCEFSGILTEVKGSPPEKHEAKLNLVWKRAMAPFSFANDGNANAIAADLAREPWNREFFSELQASHHERYEQFGSVTGELRLGDHTFTVNALGARDRAWGIYDWAHSPRYVTHYFHASTYNPNETTRGSMSTTRGSMANSAVSADSEQAGGLEEVFFNLSLVSLPTTTHHLSGFVAARGDRERGVPVHETSAALPCLGNDGVPPSNYSFGFTAGAECYVLKVTVKEEMTQGVDMGEGRMWVNFRWTDYEVIREARGNRPKAYFKGSGASEFGYRIEGVEPFCQFGHNSKPTSH